MPETVTAEELGIDSIDPTNYEFDPRPADEETAKDYKAQQIAVVRNSDRALFRRCRRRWGWNSHLRGNLGPKRNANPLWLGTGFHYALEDYHGFRNHSTAMEAFKAYSEATRKQNIKRVPLEWRDLEELAVAMLDYYTNIWLNNRPSLDTYVFNGVPQVEVNVRIEIPWEVGRYGYDRVIYSGTFDRVIVDEWGNLWIVEYKTAKNIQTLHLSYDGQISAYCWAGNQLYDRPVVGVIYQQHRKDIPKPPPFLGSGKISTAKNMLTTRGLYKQALVNLYGSVERAPIANVDYLNRLAQIESMDADKFIRRDRSERNEHQVQAEGIKLMLELEELLNPDIALYPSPTRECAHMCDFNGPCVSLDDGSDYMQELELLMEPRDPNYDSWRAYL